MNVTDIISPAQKENRSRGENQESQSSWFVKIPWFLTAACTLILIVIGLFLVLNIGWFKDSVFNADINQVNEPEYRFYAYHLHLSMIKRSVGLFSGFAIMFLGMGVAFYTLKDQTTAGIESTSVTMKIASTSPGLIALIVGGYLIIETIRSKDEFPGYIKAAEAQSFRSPLDTTKIEKIPD